jgi:integrase
MLCRQIWRYGMATGRVGRDITDGLKDALAPYRGKHFAAITDPGKLGILLRAIKAYQGGPIVRAALQLAPILFQRPGELRAAAWSEMDLEQRLWTIPPARMKREKDGKEHGDPHLVPLPKQAAEILADLYRLTGHGHLVFPGERDHERPISENSVRTALISLGYTSDSQTWHGFRATARTLLAERLECDPLVIEAQLAHAVKDPNGRAYNRTTYLEQRRKMMQQWANYLDALHDQREFAKVEAGVAIEPPGPDRTGMSEVFAKGAGRATHRSTSLKKEMPSKVVQIGTRPTGETMAETFGNGIPGLVYRSSKQSKRAEG